MCIFFIVMRTAYADRKSNWALRLTKTQYRNYDKCTAVRRRLTAEQVVGARKTATAIGYRIKGTTTQDGEETTTGIGNGTKICFNGTSRSSTFVTRRRRWPNGKCYEGKWNAPARAHTSTTHNAHTHTRPPTRPRAVSLSHRRARRTYARTHESASRPCSKRDYDLDENPYGYKCQVQDYDNTTSGGAWP